MSKYDKSNLDIPGLNQSGRGSKRDPEVPNLFRRLTKGSSTPVNPSEKTPFFSRIRRTSLPVFNPEEKKK